MGNSLVDASLCWGMFAACPDPSVTTLPAMLNGRRAF